MADICEPHMMAVNIPNRSPSNTRNMRNMVVAGGDTPEQPGTHAHKDCRQIIINTIYYMKIET